MDIPARLVANDQPCWPAWAVTFLLWLSVQVCNHPDLFEGRPIVSSFDMWGMPFHLPSLAMHALAPAKWTSLNLTAINADLLAQEDEPAWAAQERQVRVACCRTRSETLNPLSCDNLGLHRLQTTSSCTLPSEPVSHSMACMLLTIAP